MDIEEVLSLLDNEVIAIRGDGLTSQDKEIIRQTWEGLAYDEMQSLGLSTEYIKKMKAPDLWKFLSKVIGEKVTKKILKRLLNKSSGERIISLLSSRLPNVKIGEMYPIFLHFTIAPGN